MDPNYFVIEEVVEEEELIEEKEIMTNAVSDSVGSDDTTQAEEASFGNENLAECPSCGKSTLKVEGGCHSCVNEECGFSKCDI